MVEHDGLSQTICVKCANHIILAYKFRIKAINAEKALKLQIYEKNINKKKFDDFGGDGMIAEPHFINIKQENLDYCSDIDSTVEVYDESKLNTDSTKVEFILPDDESQDINIKNLNKDLKPQSIRAINKNKRNGQKSSSSLGSHQPIKLSATKMKNKNGPINQKQKIHKIRNPRINSYCCVTSCQTRKGDNYKLFAVTEKRLNVNDWLKNLKLGLDDIKNTKLCVCERHFEKKYVGTYKLVPSAIPTVFLE